MIAVVLDHVWQSTFFALGCALLALLLRRNRAAIRYWIWFAASAKFLLPYSLLAAAGTFLFRPLAAPVSAPMIYALQPAARPFSAAAPMLATSGGSEIHWSIILLALWAAGFATVAVLTLMRWVRLNDNLHAAAEVPSSLPIPIKLSGSSIEPGLIGIWRPVLLLPDGFSDCLSAAEVDAVLAHELCHLKRRDNLTITIHMLVEALFWFQPLVWWIGSQLIKEREYACDEAVLQSGNDPQVYAESILKVCKHYLRSPLPSASGVSGADLKLRIECIVQHRPSAHLNTAQKGVLSASVTASFCIPLFLGLTVPPARLMTKPVPENFAQRFAEQSLPRKQVVIAPALYGNYIGHYILDPENVVTVQWINGHFLSHITNQPDIEFFPESPSKFFAKRVPAQISFEVGTGDLAKVLIIHQNGNETRAERIDPGRAKTIEAVSIAHYRSQKQSAGTEAALRAYLASLEAGRPDYQQMTDNLAAVTRRQWPAIRRFIRQWGPVQSVSFDGVSRQSGDMYLVHFQHGLAMFAVAPVRADGKMHGLFMQPLR